MAVWGKDTLEERRTAVQQQQQQLIDQLQKLETAKAQALAGIHACNGALEILNAQLTAQEST